MRLRGKVDSNQAEIVKALRKAGCSVQSLANLGGGVPDLLIGFRGRNILAEVKDARKPPSARKLTPAEKKWIEAWQGERVLFLQSMKDVIQFLAAMAYMA